MAKSKRREYPLSDLRAYLRLFFDESDRAAGVLARALLEEYLGRLLSAFFTPDTDAAKLLRDADGPAASFSRRIRLAEALGLLAPDEASDLNIIREIGNDFAHGLDHTMSFDDESIRQRVANLQTPQLVLEFLEPGSLDASFAATMKESRGRFTVAVAILQSHLSRRADATKRCVPLKSLLTLARNTPGAVFTPERTESD